MGKIITFGEIMGRLAAPGALRFSQVMPGSLELTFAGAEANAAVAVTELGGTAAFITALPSHAMADACVAQLRGFGIETDRYSITHIVDRLGVGDAFTGSLLFALTTPEWSEPGRTLQFATAASCLAHSIQGDYNRISRDDVEALLAGDDSGRVRR